MATHAPLSRTLVSPRGPSVAPNQALYRAAVPSVGVLGGPPSVPSTRSGGTGVYVAAAVVGVVGLAAIVGLVVAASGKASPGATASSKPTGTPKPVAKPAPGATAVRPAPAPAPKPSPAPPSAAPAPASPPAAAIPAAAIQAGQALASVATGGDPMKSFADVMRGIPGLGGSGPSFTPSGGPAALGNLLGGFGGGGGNSDSGGGDSGGSDSGDA